MLKTFACKETERIWATEVSRKLPQDIQRSALRKLRMLDGATNLSDLKSPPANHLEQLRGDLSGFYSIRINDQWRICFAWDGQDVTDVEICDYP